MSYKIIFYKQAVKDYEKVKKNASLKKIVKKHLTTIEQNPYSPPYEKLSGNLAGLYSKRINRQHRLVYNVIEETKTIQILSLWSHYENI